MGSIADDDDDVADEVAIWKFELASVSWRWELGDASEKLFGVIGGAVE